MRMLQKASGALKRLIIRALSTKSVYKVLGRRFFKLSAEVRWQALLGLVNC